MKRFTSLLVVAIILVIGLTGCTLFDGGSATAKKNSKIYLTEGNMRHFALDSTALASFPASDAIETEFGNELGFTKENLVALLTGGVPTSSTRGGSKSSTLKPGAKILVFCGGGADPSSEVVDAFNTMGDAQKGGKTGRWEAVAGGSANVAVIYLRADTYTENERMAVHAEVKTLLAPGTKVYINNMKYDPNKRFPRYWKEYGKATMMVLYNKITIAG